VQINLTGGGTLAPEGTLVALRSAKADDTNSIAKPTKIVPVTSKITGLRNTFIQTLPPYSINILQLNVQWQQTAEMGPLTGC
jgi:alpha-N-arabinofuranosidase